MSQSAAEQGQGRLGKAEWTDLLPHVSLMLKLHDTSLTYYLHVVLEPLLKGSKYQTIVRVKSFNV